MGKGQFLIDGYNILSSSEKEKYDTDALRKYLAVAMFVLAFGSTYVAVSGRCSKTFGSITSGC